ncbi:transaldolase [Saccharothrix sp.]|uniref:transaldolase n=1 Tax=Saccharothrix sp. TaxID=1873460 RepID=UPI0028113DE1|nr:transaldolase [Saccharothrix sp.]
MPTTLHGLAERGQSPWLDHLSRSLVQTGDLGELVRDGVVGVTSNPTIFQGAIAEGDAYDDQLRDVLDAEPDPKEAFLVLARDDIRAACDLLSDVFARGGPHRDGWVSLEVDPRFPDDTRATVEEARRLHGLVDRMNLLVKIPGTEAGPPAIEEVVASGIPVNVTLLFSLRRHRVAAEAYVRGLRRLHDQGGDLHTVTSVASFFVSRVDTEADRRLDEIGGHDDLKGTLAIANAKLAYLTYQELFTGPDWEELAAAGASPQRCLWASTSTKNPAYRDVRYVEELIGPGTVTTMPLKTVRAFLDHGQVADTLRRDVDDARRTMDRFAEAGVDYDDVTAVLEREGVAKFADSYRQLFDGIAEKRAHLVRS